MLTWSTSATSVLPKPTNRSTKPDSKVAEQFLNSWDNAVYDGAKIGDAELDKEASRWREKFVHLRIEGKSVGGQKVTHPMPLFASSAITNGHKAPLNHSKSANTFREKVNNSNITLPKIGKN